MRRDDFGLALYADASEVSVARGVVADHGCLQRVGGVVGQPEVAAEDVDALLPVAEVYATAALADTWEQH